MNGAHPGDLRRDDLAIAVAVAIATLLFASLALGFARAQADTPIIDVGIGVPIRVKPVLDVAASGVSAGGKGEAALPVEWARPEPPPETVPSVTPEPQPQPRRRKPNTKNSPAVEPPPGPEPPVGDATTGGAGEGGETEGEGIPGGDPLGARAIAAYRQRLIGWLAARFEVRGSGLTRDELEKMRARAQIEISEDGVVLDYTILSADHPTFEAAARVALDAVKGEPVPPPPDYYPGALQRRIKVTFVCTESTCD